MAREFTEFQRQAIETDGQDICVAAGAGSGKTGVLVERFVRLIQQSQAGQLPPSQCANVDEILVITFTEKATKEMKSRIVAELNRLNLVEERRQLETAYISTIHGFCSRLLQENPFEAGVDPQFTVLDAPQAKRLLWQTFDEVIARAYNENETEITELVASMQAARFRSDEGGDALTALVTAVETTLNKARGAGKSLEEAEAHWLLGRDVVAARSLEPVYGIFLPVLNEIRACYEGLKEFKANLIGTYSVAFRTLEENAPRLEPEAAGVLEIVQALESVYQVVNKVRARSGAVPEEMRLHSLFQRIKLACEETREFFGAVATREERAAEMCHRLWGLTVAVWKEYAQAKRRLGKLDADDLQAEGVRLLEQSPSVRKRYRKRFKHLMVDEFQDTNAHQMRLVELLHQAEPGECPPNLLFVVGDVQQSIYGFRNADSTLFRALERDFRIGRAGVHVPLSVNFRSRPEILRLVEQVFRQVWHENETPFVPLTPGAEFDAKPLPSVEILATQDLMRRDYLQLEPDALAARIQRLVESQEVRLTHPYDPRRGEPVSYRDVAVLIRALTDIQKYEEAFARRGVPYFVVGGGRGYYVRHEIRDLLNILTVLDTPLDDVALAATLRSPFVGVDMDTLYQLALRAQDARNEEGESVATRSSARPLYPTLLDLLETLSLPDDAQARLEQFVRAMEELRRQEDRLPVGHLLERLIARTQYDARLLCRPGGRRRLANVRKLLQMANSDPVMGVREFIRRLRDLEKLSDREGEAPTEEEAADVVRFFTIHSAKGLEFPVTVLADLSRGLLIKERGQFLCDPQRLALGVQIEGEQNLVFKAIERNRLAADREELERLLYVAMTRAREHLILCANLGRNRNFNWADNLFPLLGLLSVPPEPEIQRLTGGIAAQVAPLTYYAHTPSDASASPPPNLRRQSDAEADRLAAAILQEAPLAPLLRALE